MRHEFAEGVKALLVDKRQPVWREKRIEDVSQELLDSFFAEKPNEWHPTQ